MGTEQGHQRGVIYQGERRRQLGLVASCHDAEDRSDAGVFGRQRQRDLPLGCVKVMEVTNADDRCLNLGTSKDGIAVS